MTLAETIGVGFGTAMAVSLVATPAAIRLARRTGFYDHPREYRQHGSPTPFLGGAAVMAGFLVAALTLGGISLRLLVPLICGVGMWLLGTLDDGLGVAPKWRLLAAGMAALALYLVGLGWHTAATGVVNLPLTILWIVGLVNAFNLMDNLDGVCSAVSAVSAAGIGIVAASKGQPVVAGLAFALAGACAGFLPWNMTRPARIFLGDGGSMPVGFLVATLAMLTANNSPTGRAGILLGALLVGLPMLDATLVSLSRTRRGVSLMTGGRDHLAHRLLLAVRSPRQVAIILAVSQGILCGLAIVGYEFDTAVLEGVALASFLAGVGVILMLDTERWRPAGIAYGPLQARARAEPARASPGVDTS